MSEKKQEIYFKFSIYHFKFSILIKFNLQFAICNDKFAMNSVSKLQLAKVLLKLLFLELILKKLYNSKNRFFFL